MTTYNEALESTSIRRIVTVTVSPLNMSTGEIETYYFANAAFRTPPDATEPNLQFIDRLGQIPEVERKLLGTAKTGGRSEITRANLEIKNADGAYDFLDSRNYAWDGRAVVIKDGAEGVAYADFETIFVGTAKAARAGTDALKIELRDAHYRLEKNITERYRGRALAWSPNGTADYVVVPNSVIIESAGNANSYTVECWARMSGAQESGRACLFSWNKSTTATEQDHLAILVGGDTLMGGGATNGEVEIALNTGGSASTASLDTAYQRNMRDGLWHHYAMSVDRNLKRYLFYIDGVLVRTFTASVAEAVFNRLTIGAYNKNNGTYQWFWRGDVTDVRFWKTARTAREIFDNHEALLGLNSAGLSADYHLDEGINTAQGLGAGEGTVEDGDEAIGLIVDYSLNERHAGLVTVENGTWASTGEGREPLAGKQKMLVLGDCFNIEPDVLDDRLLLYGVSHAVRAYDTVKDKGALRVFTTALSYDGINDLTTISDNAAYDIANTDDFAIEIDFVPGDAGAAVERLVNMTEGAGNRRWEVGITSDRLVTFKLTDSTAQEIMATGSQVLVPGGRYWITLVYLGGTKTAVLFLNGEHQASKTNTAIAGNFNASASVLLGSTGTTSWFTGLITDVRLWKNFGSLGELRLRRGMKLLGTETGLIGWWDHSDGSGATLADKSGTGNNGTITGALWTPTDVDVDLREGTFALRFEPAGGVRADVRGWLPLGFGPQFDGLENSGAEAVEYAGCDVDADDDLTFECWFRWGTDVDPFPAGGATLAGKWDGFAAGWRIYIDVDDELIKILMTDNVTTSGPPSFLSGGTTFNFPIGWTPDDGEFHYLCVTYDHSEQEFVAYNENGLISIEPSFANVGDCSNTEAFRMGGLHVAGTWNGWVGTIVRAALWKRVLTELEIMTNCRRPIYPGTDVSCVGNWPMNENTGSLCYDLTTGAHPLTLTGSVWSRGPYPETAKEFILWTLAQRTDITLLEIDLDSLDEFDVARPGVMGGVFRDELVADVFDKIVSPLGWYDWTDAGLLRFGEIVPPESRWVKEFDTIGESQVKFTDNAAIDLEFQSGSVAGGMTLEARILLRNTPSGDMSVIVSHEHWTCWLLNNAGATYLVFETGHSGDQISFVATESLTPYLNTEIHLSVVLLPSTGTSSAFRQVAMYVNGELLETMDSYIIVLDENRSNAGLLCIGHMYNGTAAAFFDGQISEVRVWNTPLTATQILARWHTHLRGDESNLVGYAKLSEGLDNPFISYPTVSVVSEATSDTAEWIAIGNNSVPLYRECDLTLGDTNITIGTEPRTLNNFIYGSVEPGEMDLPAKEVVISYRKNHSPYTQEDLAAVVFADRTALSALIEESSKIEIFTGADEFHLIPSPREDYETLFRDLEDARRVAHNVKLLRGQDRQRLFVVAPLAARRYGPGDDVRLRSPRYVIGLAGRNFLIIGIKYLTSRLVRFEVIG